MFHNRILSILLIPSKKTAVVLPHKQSIASPTVGNVSLEKKNIMKKKPNILFMHVDQMHWEAMSRYGNKNLHTRGWIGSRKMASCRSTISWIARARSSS